MEMKKIAFLGLALCLFSSGFAQKTKRKTVPQKKKTEVAAATNPSKIEKTVAENSVRWYGFEGGYKKAVATNKILLVDAYTEWCGWCKVICR